ncbi:MAG: hypothetical protein ACPGSM_15940 [Thiolinea sp.]
MAAIPPPLIQDPTLSALDEALVVNQEKHQRRYLGASAIGDLCQRKLWYQFRRAMSPQDHDAKTLKRFEDGHRGEDIMAERLRLLPFIELHTEENGQQFEVSAHGGHFLGHLDGAIRGLLQAPKTYCVWEHKQVGESKFRKLNKLKTEKGEKQALQEWDEVYFAQAQVYMHLTGMQRHYLTCCTPGGRDHTSVRTHYDKQKANYYINRARMIITANEPPPRVSDDPEYYYCKRFKCQFLDICHGRQLPRKHCRTCAHSTADTTKENGVWTCARAEGQEIPDHVQKVGCPQHIYIPALLEKLAKPIDADEQANWIEYETPTGVKFKNASAGTPGCFDSDEIRCGAAQGNYEAFGDSEIMELKEKFGARVAGRHSISVDDEEKSSIESSIIYDRDNFQNVIKFVGEQPPCQFCNGTGSDPKDSTRDCLHCVSMEVGFIDYCGEWAYAVPGDTILSVSDGLHLVPHKDNLPVSGELLPKEMTLQETIDEIKHIQDTAKERMEKATAEVVDSEETV